MRKPFKICIFLFLLSTFVFSLLRTSNLSLLQCSEEEVEMVAKISEEEGDEELTYNFEELISHEMENIRFEEKNASEIHRIFTSNYLEPHLENLSYPPEFKAVI